MNKKTKKGFTLIELLIVIAIIGVLAVAFLPTLLGAPSKGRDTSRIADLQKIQGVLINHDLGGGAYPDATTWEPFDAELVPTLLPEFGGIVPDGPQEGESYYYNKDVIYDDATYSFGLAARIENFENANATCTFETGAITGIVDESLSDPAAVPAATQGWCFVILTQ